MAFLIEDAIWEMFPGMLLVVAAGTGLDNVAERPAIRQKLEVAQAQLKEGWQYPNAQSHPHIAAWRQAFQKMGVSGKNYPSAIESLARRVLTGREVALINPFVDLYNAISLSYVVPVGGWDTDDLQGGDILLRLTTGGEPFTELGQSSSTPASAGEVSYMDAEQLITRHFVWRQAERAKIVPTTTSFFLVSEILPEVGRSVAENVQRSFVDSLQEHFNISPKSAILDSSTTRWEFT